jgi:hypothetical protein
MENQLQPKPTDIRRTLPGPRDRVLQYVQKPEGTIRSLLQAGFTFQVDGEVYYDIRAMRVALGSTLSLIWELIELKPDKEPTDKAYQELLNFIIECYPDIHIEEILLAFKMAFSNQLAVEKVEHFQSFGIAYFSRIMNAYLDYKKKVVKKTEAAKKALPEIDKTRMLIDDHLSSRPLNDQAVKQMIWELYEDLCNDRYGRLSVIPLGRYYFFLKEIGLVNLDQEEGNRIITEVRHRLDNHLDPDKRKYDNDILRYHCYNEMVLSEMKKWKSAGYDFYDLIGFLDYTACYINPDNHDELKFLFKQLNND